MNLIRGSCHSGHLGARLVVMTILDLIEILVPEYWFESNTGRLPFGHRLSDEVLNNCIACDSIDASYERNFTLGVESHHSQVEVIFRCVLVPISKELQAWAK